MSLYRKCIYVSFIALVLIFSGCSDKGNNKLWTSEDCEIIEVSYLEGEVPYADVWECVLPFDREVLGSYCLYDFKVYYEVNYWNMLVDQTGMTPNKEFSKEYNTQIRCYDMVNQTDELIYRYDSTKCEDVINMECNGTYLIWENINRDSWELYSIRLQEDNSSKPDIITRLSEGEFATVFFTLQEDSVFWYDYENGRINLYSYNLNTGETNILYEDCTLKSPYEPPCVIDDRTILYRTDDTDTTQIISIDRKNKQKLQVQVQSEVADIEFNDDFCVWRKDYGNDIELFFYDIVQEKYGKIECGDIFSYALQEQYLVLNLRNKEKWDGEGIYCIDLREYQAYYISGDDATMLWTNAGPDNVYWQEADYTNKFKIANMVFH